MATIPKDVKQFKILFIVYIGYQLAGWIYRTVANVNIKNFQWTWWNITAVVISVVLYIIFLVRLYDVANILKLNNIIRVKPWVFIVLQLVLTSKLLIPEIIVPIYIWIMSRKLGKLDSIRAFDPTKIKFPQKS